MKRRCRVARNPEHRFQNFLAPAFQLTCEFLLEAHRTMICNRATDYEIGLRLKQWNCAL